MSVETYQYDDGVDDGTDPFAREPFGVLVYSHTTQGKWSLGTLTTVKFRYSPCFVSGDKNQ